jgi:hypothetical protein
MRVSTSHNTAERRAGLVAHTVAEISGDLLLPPAGIALIAA